MTKEDIREEFIKKHKGKKCVVLLGFHCYPQHNDPLCTTCLEIYAEERKNDRIV